MTSSPPTSAGLLCWRDGPIAHIRFNRPQALNAIDLAMASAFFKACREVADDAQVRVVVLSGEGRAFMAGGDIAAMQNDPVATAGALIDGMHGGIRILSALPVPVIASVHGAVAGGGLGVALACDLAIAAEGTRFELAYPKIGASSDCSTSWNLVRLVGMRKALELALLALPVSAEEALRLGLINRLVPQAQLVAETAAIAQQLAASAPLALARLKKLVREAPLRTLEEQLDAEAEAFKASAATGDFAEGVAAFLAKRQPLFTGR